MQYIIEGLLLGLTLAMLVGPIVLVLIQSSLERGARAGLIAASGIWISDFLIIGFSLYFIKQISPFIHDKGFVFWLGLTGGVVLIITGVLSFFKKTSLEFSSSGLKTFTILNYFTKGFLVNTINPFTFIFWLSVISTLVATRHLNKLETSLFLGSIMFVIIVSDSLKVILARMIRARISEVTLTHINRISGILLMIFGIVLIYRSLP